MIKRKISILLMACVIPFGAIQAQLNKEVKVVKAYIPKISSATKISKMPKIVDTAKVETSFDYAIEPVLFRTPFTINPLGASRLAKEPRYKLYHSYWKLGFGNYLSPYAELNLNSLRNSKHNLGLKMKHHSAHGKIKMPDEQKVYSGFSDNLVNIYGKKYFSKAELSANVDFESVTRYFYGYDTLLTDITLRAKVRDSMNFQRYMMLGGNIDIKSNNRGQYAFLYDISTNYYYMKDMKYAQEHGAWIDIALSKKFRKTSLGMESVLRYYHRIDSLGALDQAIINLNPWFGFGNENIQVKLGANTYFDRLVNSYHFYPRLNVFFNVSDLVVPYLGITGGLEPNTYRNMIGENPYMSENINVRTTNKRIHVFGGLRGNLSSKLAFHFNADYKEMDDMFFYVLDTTDHAYNRFDVVYDTVKMLRVQGELSLRKIRNFSFVLKGNYYQYTLLNELHPWHHPQFDITFSTRYNFNDAFLITADLYVLGKQYFKSFNPAEPVFEQKPIFDLNLGAEYRWTEKISAFIQCNNILFQQYYAWHNYPMMGFNMHAGINYSF